MLQRMETGEKVLTVRSKFNNLMERLLADRRDHYTIDVNPILYESEYFTPSNELNEDGKIIFWKEIDECI